MTLFAPVRHVPNLARRINGVSTGSVLLLPGGELDGRERPKHRSRVRPGAARAAETERRGVERVARAESRVLAEDGDPVFLHVCRRTLLRQFELSVGRNRETESDGITLRTFSRRSRTPEEKRHSPISGWPSGPSNEIVLGDVSSPADIQPYALRRPERRTCTFQPRRVA